MKALYEMKIINENKDQIIGLYRLQHAGVITDGQPVYDYALKEGPVSRIFELKFMNKSRLTTDYVLLRSWFIFLLLE